MNRLKIGLILYWVVLVLIISFLEYSDYKIEKSELGSIVSFEINELYDGQETEVQIIDIHESRRIIVYSGVIISEGQKNPFLFGFQKSLLYSTYKPPRHIISYSSKYIDRPKISLDTYIFKYWLYQDEVHNVIIDRKLNYRSIFQLVVVIAVTVFVNIKRKQNISS